jgi:hypothetical protein
LLIDLANNHQSTISNCKGEARRVKARWVVTPKNRRARVYEITAAGKRRLEAEETRWRTVTLAVGQVLERI